MTTLEHLKYFFLFNLGDKKIEEYNDKQTDESKKFKCVNANCSNLLNDGEDVDKYRFDFQMGERKLIEEVKMGGMKYYHLLQILQELRGIPNETFNKFKSSTASQAQYNYPDLGFTPKPNARFIMFANMKAHAKKEDVAKIFPANQSDKELIDNIKLICNAEIDTLEFAHSVASTTTGNPAAALAAPVPAAFASSTGGAIKYSRAKKYLTSRRRKHTLKRLGQIKQNSIYSRRSKKYY